ncbi:MAG: SLC13 family permease, partial [Ornithinimicrobium sp.]
MSQESARRTEEKAPSEGAPDDGPRASSRTWMFRGLGLVVAVAVYLLLAGSDLSADGRVVAAIGALMAVWWMTEAIPLSVTSLLPIVLFPTLTDIDIGAATSPYANDIVFLFLGGFLIAIAMQKWNLHRRIALLTLRRVGTHPRQIILGMMISTAFLSMWVSNTATTLMMLPIAMSVLALVVEGSSRTSGEGTAHEDLTSGRAVSEVIEDSDVRLFGVALVLSIAWAASIGGLGTLLGSPPNAIVAGYVSEELDQEIGFVQWMMLGVPLVVVFLGIAWFLITRVMFRFNLAEIPGGREMINDEIAGLGEMSQAEKTVLAVFCGAAFLWIVPGILSGIGSLGEQFPWLDA